MGRFVRRRSAADRRQDRISALPDDLLLLVLRRVDTRTALRTGTLARRWVHLPRELPALDFRVADLLPPSYHRWIQLRRDIGESFLLYGTHALTRRLMPNIWRHERRAMRAWTRSIHTFLDGACRRTVSRLSLEFFATHNAGCCVNRLIEEAIDAWGLDDLEAVARPSFMQGQVHTFPTHGLCKEPRSSRLRSLKLGGCLLPPLHDFTKLTMLVLQDIPKSTPGAAYERVFTSCPQLQVLHLISCGCQGDMVVDAPMSEIRELVVENCRFKRMRLRALPSLESLASLLGWRVTLESTSLPCLRRCNLTLDFGVTMERFRLIAQLLKLELGYILGHILNITSLIIRFTGSDRWIVPSSAPSSLLPNLRRLLVADVPSSWDVSWPRLLLEAAPLLETLHIHIAPCLEEPGDEIPWQPTSVGHHHLKEFVMAGFQGTERQIYLVKFVMGVCTVLRHVAMFRNGHARNKGHWDWEMVTQQQVWTDEEKDNTLKQIMDGVSSSTTPVQVVLG